MEIFNTETKAWQVTETLIPGDTIRFTEPTAEIRRGRPSSNRYRTNIVEIKEVHFRDTKSQDKFVFEIKASHGDSPLQAGDILFRNRYCLFRCEVERLLWEDENFRSQVACENYSQEKAKRKFIRNGKMKWKTVLHSTNIN